MQGYYHDLDPGNTLEHLHAHAVSTAAFRCNEDVRLKIVGKKAVGIGFYLLQINRISLKV